MGAIAMTAFFMLSGYSLYLSNGKKEFRSLQEIKNFYTKRFIGVFPVYYLTAILFIIMTFAVDYAGFQTTNESALQHLLIVPIDLLGLQSIFTGSFSFSHHGGTWFISCIAICYMIYPYLQSIINQLSEKSKFTLIGLMVLILLISPLLQALLHWESIYDNPLIRAMEFMIGIILANLNQHSTNKILNIFQTRYALFISVIILFVGVSLAWYLGIGKGFYMLYSWIALPTFIVILLSLGKLSFPDIQNSKVILYLSEISYVFFMAQFFVWPICRLVFKTTGFEGNLFKILFSLSVCFIISICMHELFEKPTTKFLKCKLL